MADEGGAVVLLRGDGEEADEPLRRLLVAPEGLHRGRDDVLRRLRAFVGLAQEGPLQVDTQDLGAAGAFLLHDGHLAQGGGEHGLALGHGGGQQGGDALAGGFAQPLAEPFGRAVVDIEAVAAVGVGVDKAGHNPGLAKIVVGGGLAVRGDPDDPPVFHRQLGWPEAPGEPDIPGLDDHGHVLPCCRFDQNHM